MNQKSPHLNLTNLFRMDMKKETKHLIIKHAFTKQYLNKEVLMISKGRTNYILYGSKTYNKGNLTTNFPPSTPYSACSLPRNAYKAFKVLSPVPEVDVKSERS